MQDIGPTRTAGCIRIILQARCSAMPHSGASLLDHLLGTAALLEAWRMPEPVILAGLCHSFFGDTPATRARLGEDLRTELIQLMGGRAFRLAVLFAARGRSQLYCRCDACRPSGRSADPRVGPLAACDAIPLSPEDLATLAHLAAANALDQASRLGDQALPDPSDRRSIARFLSPEAFPDAAAFVD